MFEGEEYLDRATEDADREDKRAENILKVVQFHLTAVTVIGGASVAMLNGIRTDFDRLDVFVMIYFAVLVWIYLGLSSMCLVGALEARDMGVVPPLASFADWRERRAHEIVEVDKLDADIASEVAEREVVEAMGKAYATAAATNQRVNESRQANLTSGTHKLICAALMLAGLAAAYVSHVSLVRAHG